MTHYFWPHIGGVEKHVKEVSISLSLKKHKLTVLTEKYASGLKNQETKDGVKILRFKYPHIKFLGLLSIWFWLWQNRTLIKQSDLIQIHDVFIWYLPFRFLYPRKPVFTTIHGLEWDNPFSPLSLWQKKLAVKLSTGTIGVGKYLEKYQHVKFNTIIYGAADRHIHLGGAKARPRGGRTKIIYVGRLEENTGLGKFIKWLNDLPFRSQRRRRVDFCGDGPLRAECEKYGQVHGFCDPEPYLNRADLCVPGGYLAYLEAKAAGCRIKTFAQNQLRKDYWLGIKKIKKIPTWQEVTDAYLDLYHRFQ